MHDSPKRLLKVLDPLTDAAGVDWYPIATWALDEEAVGTGYPWQLQTTLRLGSYRISYEWEYMALTCHLVTGIEDRYEHTFDSWDRKGEVDRWQWCELMVPVDYQVAGAAQALGADLETADQFLLYRTLHSRLPAPMLKWFAGQCGWWERHDAAPDASVLEQWHQAAEVAPAKLAEEYAGVFSWPAPCVPLCQVTPVLDVVLPAVASPGRNAAAARLLNYALAANLVPWSTLFSEGEVGRLTLREHATTHLREAIHQRGDLSHRIGTEDGGEFSDAALRLLLQARLTNLVAPRTLWSWLGVLEEESGTVDHSDWRLPIPGEMRAVHPRPLPEM